MRDEKKNKQELLGELRELRERNARLERSISESGITEKTVASRVAQTKNLSAAEKRQFSGTTNPRKSGISGMHPVSIVLESHNLYSALFTNSPQALAAVIAPGRITEVNPAFQSMFGYSKEEADDLTMRDLTCPEDRQNVEDQVAALYRGDLEHFRMEALCCKKNGASFWGDFTFTAVPGREGTIETAIAVIADITETKEVRHALKERDALIRALYHQVAQAIASTDDTGKFIEINPSFERMFGYSREEALGLTHLDITPPEYFQVSAEKADALFRQEIDSYRLEKLYRRKDGTLFWGDVSIAAFQTPDHRVHSVAVIVDISDRKRAEEALQKSYDELEQRVLERTAELAQANERLKKEIAERTRAQEALKQSEERFRAIFETAKDCLFIKGRDLRYVLVNPAMEQLLEMPASEVIRRTDSDLFGAQAGNLLQELDLRVLAGEIIEAEQTRPVRGIPMTFLDIRAPMLDANGQVVGICGISRNITERTKTVSLAAEDVDEVRSPAMRSALAEALMAARTDIIVLLTGESGAGKDHLARYIHNHSRRASGPFYAINCAAIPPELAESELFGHEAGAFTGATRRKRGLLELAEGGTLLLNEIGELPVHLQAKLLTFLDTRSFTRVGGEVNVTVSARLIAATNRQLAEEVAKGRFREDLYYRLNVLAIRVPPLRERIDDIPLLVKQVVSQLASELQLATMPSIGPEDMDKLMRYRWPGNVRELRNVLERAVIVSGKPHLSFNLLASETADKGASLWTIHFPPRPSLVHVIKDMRRSLIMEALSRSGGNKQEASKLLGVSRFVLRRQMKTLRLDVPK